MAKARERLPVDIPERLEPRVGPSDSSDSASDLIGTGLDGRSGMLAAKAILAAR